MTTTLILLVVVMITTSTSSSFGHNNIVNNNNNNNNNNEKNLLPVENQQHQQQQEEQQAQQKQREQRKLQTDDDDNDDVFVCNICGSEDKEITNWDGMINWANFLDHDNDANDDNIEYDNEILVSCEQLYDISLYGGITPDLCNELIVQQTTEICDCQSQNTTSTSSTTETSSSSSSMDDDDYDYYCYTNLTEIALLDNEEEDAVLDDTINNKRRRREIILCPNTVFEMGYFHHLINNNNQEEEEEEEETYMYYVEEGYPPIRPKPNSHYKCGYDGSSYSNCIIRGGDFAILSIYNNIENQDDIDIDVDNDDDNDDDTGIGIIIFEGITFESNKKSSVVLNKRGNYKFIDCIFRNQQNFGTIIIPFGNDNNVNDFNDDDDDEIPTIIATLLRRRGSHHHHNNNNNNNRYLEYNNNNNIPTHKQQQQQQQRKLQRRTNNNNDDDDDNNNDIFVCSVCIGNAPVTNPDIVIGETRCDVIQNLGLTGYLPQDTCKSITITVHLLCGCDDPPTYNPSSIPSSRPTNHPSYNPTSVPSITTIPSIVPSFSTSPTVDTSTLTITFRQTVFEGNHVMGKSINTTSSSSSSSSEFVRPGIISAESERVVLIFEDVKFRNNQFGDPTIQERTWAVKTSGPLTMTNTCFEDNEFLGIGTVLTIGYPAVNVSNNFGTYMDGVDKNCQFLVKVPDDDDDGSDGGDIITLRNDENATFWCIPFDSTECQAHDPPTNAPSVVPSDSPSSSPVNPPSYWISDDDKDDVVGDTSWRETTFSGASSCHFDVLLRIIPTMMMVAMVGTTWAAFLSIV